MEVHHHPDVERKTFKQYLLEGLMIFIAVTLGFFAESLREHISERHRERAYITSFAEDLRIDTARINASIYWSGWNIRHLDTLEHLLLGGPSTQSDIIKVYKLQTYTETRADVHFNDRTYTQLQNSGQLRLIHLDSVSRAILDYEDGIKDCMEQDFYYKDVESKLINESKSVYNGRYLYPVYEHYFSITDTSISYSRGTRNVFDSLAAIEPLRLATKDPAVFEQYSNDLGFYAAIITAYVGAISIQRQRAVALLRLLQRQYKIH
jgi:hypothetical protein